MLYSIHDLLSSDDNVFISRKAVCDFGLNEAVILAFLYEVSKKNAHLNVQELSMFTNLSAPQIRKALKHLVDEECVYYTPENGNAVIIRRGREYYAELGGNQDA